MGVVEEKLGAPVGEVKHAAFVTVLGHRETSRDYFKT
jgi:hypothetical protein